MLYIVYAYNNNKSIGCKANMYSWTLFVLSATDDDPFLNTNTLRDKTAETTCVNDAGN